MTIGRKDDDGKRRWSLLPLESIEPVIDVLMHGAAKYGVDNWRHVEDSDRRFFDAAMRHLTAWRQGESADPETGLPHLAHAACCVLFLLGDRDPR